MTLLEIVEMYLLIRASFACICILGVSNNPLATNKDFLEGIFIIEIFIYEMVTYPFRRR